MRYALIALCAVVFASAVAPTPAFAWWRDGWRQRFYCATGSKPCGNTCIAKNQTCHKH